VLYKCVFNFLLLTRNITVDIFSFQYVRLTATCINRARKIPGSRMLFMRHLHMTTYSWRKYEAL